MTPSIPALYDFRPNWRKDEVFPVYDQVPRQCIVSMRLKELVVEIIGINQLDEVCSSPRFSMLHIWMKVPSQTERHSLVQSAIRQASVSESLIRRDN